MSNLQVTDVTVPVLLSKLKSGEWLNPQFQRDFVWSTAAVISFLNSIIDAKPVGMVTLWEQNNPSSIGLEHVSVPDWDPTIRNTSLQFYGEKDARPGQYYAILDGRQRSTALALAFGGLRAKSGLYRTAGRYFLDVTATDDTERVKFILEKDIKKQRLDNLDVAVQAGLFPLAVDDPESIWDVWMSYLQKLRDRSIYVEIEAPDDAELERRNRILQQAFNGIIKTKIAVYTVPKTYDLAEICEIFETLNTTGTKVSTVDLIHSWLYSDTVLDPGGPLLLRDKIDELGEYDGAFGWSSSKDRPELIAQFVAATHVALDNKPDPRQITGSKITKISSVKSQDILAIPSLFWKKVFDSEPDYAEFIRDFQLATTGGRFTMSNCPYPASAAIYVALRAYLAWDKPRGVQWDKFHLDGLFRAFFWRNVFLSRYDQGFLTQIGTDIRALKEFLATHTESEHEQAWRARADAWLTKHFQSTVSQITIEDAVSDGSQAGALKKGVLLLLLARAKEDIIDPNLDISYLSGNLTLHHFFPKDWCANNKSPDLISLLDSDLAGRDWINSAANLIPMHRSTNIDWRKKVPAQYLAEKDIDYSSRSQIFEKYFISEEAFGEVLRSGPGVAEFWKIRKEALASELMRLMRV